jgi:hypothetical protein
VSGALPPKLNELEKRQESDLSKALDKFFYMRCLLNRQKLGRLAARPEPRPLRPPMRMGLGTSPWRKGG